MKSMLWHGGGGLDAYLDTPEFEKRANPAINAKIKGNLPMMLLNNLWINAIEIPGDGADNDGNGYVDDINGWDFVAEDDNPEDGDGHGTHCAGTIGAVGNNGNQVVMFINIDTNFKTT